MSASSNLRGALFMSVAMAGFTINDAMTKLVGSSMNIGQMMLIRGVMATLLIGLLAWRWGALARPRLIWHPMIALRVLGEAGATVCFLAALVQIPIANIAAVLQVLPLTVTMGAALFLAEPVGWRRWSAILVGFVGILIIIRPGFEGFNAYALYGLAAVAFATMRDLATRLIPDNVPTPLISTVTAATVTLAGAALVVPYGGWSPVDATSFALLVAASVCIVVGYHFIILSLRLGQLSFIAPFRYTSLLWSLALGFLLFADRPDLPMIVGATMVVCSGLYTLYRERIGGKITPAAKSTGPSMAPEGT
ncbi:DMT family transporter [Nitratireductor sp. ZSWI3]|uniref:DMT family transporter n=1 Tax=Nitratireductor sp. ZSWI3 TaxID=2966359 RepID=UPI00214FC9B0|nr:DMT family transporter [Nitratireductor sp. ZSWI3]MCR4266697.1 DMT family transporter [Nitratireductor sp. ZSWI3]